MSVSTVRCPLLGRRGAAGCTARLAAAAGLDDRGVTDPCFLGIEGGATHTSAVLADASGRALLRGSFGPGNIRLLNDRSLASLFCETARSAADESPPRFFFAL